MNMTDFRKQVTSLIAALGLSVAAGVVVAEDVVVSIRQQPLVDALRDLGEQANLQMLFKKAELGGLNSNAVGGDMSPNEALKVMLAGTDVTYEYIDENTVVIKKISPVVSDSYSGKQKEKSDKVEIEDIIVTASRREQNLQDVPMAISVVDPQSFTDIGLTSLGDVVAYTPGFDLQSTGRPGGGGIVARGVAAGTGNTPTVGVYLDDVPLTENGPFSAFNAGTGFFLEGLLADIERVELLRGPQGTLYGATSIGGAVKYITRKPSLDEFRGNVGLQLSNTQSGGFNKIYSGRVSIPLIDSKLGLTMSGFNEDNAGFVDRVDTATGSLLLEDADYYDVSGYSGDLFFQATDKLSLRAKALRVEGEYSGESYVDILPDRQPRFRELANNETFAGTDLANTVVSGTIEYEFSEATLSSVSSYMKRDYTTLKNRDTLLGLNDVIAGYPPGTTTAVYQFQNSDFDKFVQEVRLTSNENEKWEWFTGLYYVDENAPTRFSIIGVGGPEDFNLLSGNLPSAYEEYAVFGNVTRYITSDFDVTAGLRVSRNTVGVNIQETGALAGDNSINEITDTVDTWMLAARYRPNEDMSLYVRAASGYCPAFANFGIYDPAGENLAPPLKSDSLWSYEVGAKGNFANGLFSYDLALWYIDWKDYQTYTAAFGVRTVFANTEAGITGNGFEGELTFNPLDSLFITTGVAYTDTTLNADEPFISGSAGQQMQGVPKWKASIDARYQFALSSGFDAYVGGGVRYKDKMRTAFTNSNSIDPLNPGAGGQRGRVNTPTESYFLVDINAGVVKGDVSFNLYVTNLLNDDSYSQITAIYSGSYDGEAIPVRPRTIGVTLSVDF